ncbi:MAG: GNAT family N-acetyltransferase [Myxococcota bacterium]
MTQHRLGPETRRLVLRAFEPQDAPDFYALNSHPDVLRFTGEPPLTDVKAARDAIIGYPDWVRHGFGRWACVLKETGRAIGFCGFKRLDDLHEVDLGYRFLPEHWGRGLATEAAEASMNYGREVLALSRVVGLVVKGNRASIRVLEKVGMRYERDIVYMGDSCRLYRQHA